MTFKNVFPFVILPRVQHSKGGNNVISICEKASSINQRLASFLDKAFKAFPTEITERFLSNFGYICGKLFNFNQRSRTIFLASAFRFYLYLMKGCSTIMSLMKVTQYTVVRVEEEF